ncbi:MAG TPA: hypothetical protein VFQ44_02370 [Streptosporangiaceae bacterium]|nr:hypothetical protein [Streptosporangiaceae bacterium]
MAEFTTDTAFGRAGETATRPGTSDEPEAGRCSRCLGAHKTEHVPGDNCPVHFHEFIPRDHPDGAEGDWQDWWGCPECREGRWVS